MRRLAPIALLCALLALSGCFAGPNYLGRTVGDWQDQSYEENPGLTQVFSFVIPLYPVASILAAVPDILVLNPVQFWGYDVWDGEGAAFVHENPEGGRPFWFR